MEVETSQCRVVVLSQLNINRTSIVGFLHQCSTARLLRQKLYCTELFQIFIKKIFALQTELISSNFLSEIFRESAQHQPQTNVHCLSRLNDTLISVLLQLCSSLVLEMGFSVKVDLHIDDVAVFGG